MKTQRRPKLKHARWGGLPALWRCFDSYPSVAERLCRDSIHPSDAEPRGFIGLRVSQEPQIFPRREAGLDHLEQVRGQAAGILRVEAVNVSELRH